jgi:hypothetical protein
VAIQYQLYAFIVRNKTADVRKCRRSAHYAGRDPNVPIEDTVGAIAETVKAGYVCYMGLFHPAGVPQSLP